MRHLDQPYEGLAVCGNSMCNDPDRQFGWNYAVAMKGGQLEQAIWAYKRGEHQAVWASIFARVLVGFLQQRATGFRVFDLIIASPTWVGERGRTFDHTREIIAAAAREAPAWPFDLDDPPAIIRTAWVSSMRSTSGLAGRRALAQGPLRAALHVPRPRRVAGRSILVFDDVFTDGQTLNEVARCLLGAGAAEVCGVTLARQPWGSARR